VNCGANRRVTKARAESGRPTSNCLPSSINGAAGPFFDTEFPLVPKPPLLWVGPLFSSLGGSSLFISADGNFLAHRSALDNLAVRHKWINKPVCAAEMTMTRF
jgi:hypothetical protein